MACVAGAGPAALAVALVHEDQLFKQADILFIFE
jgi:hypothetical protein